MISLLSLSLSLWVVIEVRPSNVSQSVLSMRDNNYFREIFIDLDTINYNNIDSVKEIW